MKAFRWIVIFSFVIAACQTAPKPEPAATPAPVAQVPAPEPAPVPVPQPEPDAISIGAVESGFSPLADPPHNTQAFVMHFGRTDTVTSWTVAISGPEGVVKTVKGDANTRPSFIWDGSTDGPRLTDGQYKATLTVGRGDADETVESAPFTVDITPPSGTVAVDPQPYVPGNPDSEANPAKVTFKLDLVPGGAAVANWRLSVMHPDGRRFMDFISENYQNQISWDGRASNNNALQTGITYDIVVQIFDALGNKNTIHGSMRVVAPAVTAPLTVSLDGKLIAQLKVYFPANSADFSQVSADQTVSNTDALNQLAAALKSTPGSKIRVVGHANQVLWQDPAKARYEQTETLIPLSKARAEAVLAALVDRGFDRSGFDVSGVGADDPVAAFSDQPNVWKNRRVEFMIEH